MATVSVIVPVYNMEKQIERCLNSLIKQTLFEKLEIIIVNDGSTDKSKEIIQKFKKQYPEKIVYIEKENSGLSEARNFGVKQATGEYLSFIDADDYVKENLYKNLEKYMEQKIDVIKFKMQIVKENGEEICKATGPTFGVCTGEEGFKKLCGKDNFIDPACLYLYRREFYLANKFAYKKGAYHEDFGLTSLILLKAKTFLSAEEYGYYYVQTEDSITRNNSYEKDIKKAKDLLEHYDTMIETIQQYEISKTAKELVKQYYTNAILLKAKDLKKQELEDYIKEINKRNMIQNIKPQNVKQWIKKILLKINPKLYIKMR